MFSEEEVGVCRSRSSRHWSAAGAQMGLECIFKPAKCVFFLFVCFLLGVHWTKLCFSTRSSAIRINSPDYPPSPRVFRRWATKRRLVTVNYSIVVRLPGDWWVWRHPALPPPATGGRDCVTWCHSAGAIKAVCRQGLINKAIVTPSQEEKEGRDERKTEGCWRRETTKRQTVMRGRSD